MIKVKNKDQLSILGLESWRTIYSSRKLSLLEKSWARVFHDYILPLLPAEKIFQLYNSHRGRPTKELYSTIGAVILQQFFNLTDEETIQELAFNQQWHFALECFNEDDQVISLKTLWTMRSNLVSEGLADIIFSEITDRFIDVFDVDVSQQRLDSVHVHSNMACLGRIRILAKTIIKFLKNLKRHNSRFLEEDPLLRISKKYLDKTTNSYFSQIKPSLTEQTLQSLATDMLVMKLYFENDEQVSKMTSFKLLLRVFDDHCFMKSGQLQVRKSKDISSSSVQNPSDPDAGFDGHKGQGYQTQMMETFTNKENNEKDKEPNLNMITYVETESAYKHDSKALEPAIKDVQNRGQECKEILADTLYGSDENVENAKSCGINLIAPVPGKSSVNGIDSFKFDPQTLEIIFCSFGKKPDKHKYNKKGSITAIWYHSTCTECPFEDSCASKKSKKSPKRRTFNYKRKQVILSIRRNYQSTVEFKDKYSYRSGIEATNSRFIHMTSARRSRYRGLEKMKFGQKLKALAINMFRVVKFKIEMKKLRDSCGFSLNFYYFCRVGCSKLNFAA